MAGLSDSNRVVIGDTSVLSNLFQIGRLSLLQQLFKVVYIPEAVYEELVVKSSPEYGSEVIKTTSWISILPCKNRVLVTTLRSHLDQGEAEAIALAQEYPYSLLLIDEAKGRKIAKLRGLNFMGLLGVLKIGQEQGYITTLKPLLDDLIEVGFYLSRDLYEQILADGKNSSTF